MTCTVTELIKSIDKLEKTSVIDIQKIITAVTERHNQSLKSKTKKKKEGVDIEFVSCDLKIDEIAEKLPHMVENEICDKGESTSLKAIITCLVHSRVFDMIDLQAVIEMYISFAMDTREEEYD